MFYTSEPKTLIDQIVMLNEAEQTRRGELLAEVLMLKIKRSNGRYNSSWGDKTALGLFLTVQRIIEQGA